MAIYHLHIKPCSRGSSSAKAKADYIAREGKYQADSKEVAYKESGNMPIWATDEPGNYWKSADEYERANGRLFVHVEFALPAELSDQNRQNLAKEFCRDLAQTQDGEKLPYSMAIHKGRNSENPHCHLMINERINDEIPRDKESWFKRAAKEPEKGGAKKTAKLQSRDWLKLIRVTWSEKANKSLEDDGHDSRIDHRTLKAQGIDREPQYHLGPAAAAMERKHNSNFEDHNEVTARGSEYSRYKEIIRLEKELEALKKEKDHQETIIADREKIEIGKADARARFEQWKAAKQAKEPSQKQEQVKSEQANRPRMK